MLASELIVALEKAIKTHGDCVTISSAKINTRQHSETPATGGGFAKPQPLYVGVENGQKWHTQ